MKYLYLAWLLLLAFTSAASAQTHTISPTPFPAYGLWNGFDEKLNVIECSSIASGDSNMSIEILSASGATLSSKSFTIPANGTWHQVIEKSLINNKYGMLQLDLSTPGSRGKISCASVYYKLDTTSGSLIYAFAELITAPLQGNSSGLINSINPYGESTIVNNWLRLANPLDETFSAVLELYNPSGQIQSTIPINLEAMQRMDFGLGHPDGQTLQSYRIVPQNPAHPYLVSTSRYLPNSSSFHFAFSLQGQQGACSGSKLFISTMNPARNWVEVLNGSSSPLNFTATILDSMGNSLANLAYSLDGREQTHIYVNQHLGDNNVGAIEFNCESPTSAQLIANSLHYNTAQAQQKRWAYSTQLRRASASSGEQLIFSANSYLGMENWLRAQTLGNNTAELQGAEIANFNAASGSTDSFLAMPANSVTRVAIESATNDRLYAVDSLRVVRDLAGQIELILPIPSGVVSKNEESYALNQIASGFSSPTAITHAGDKSNRLFITEKGGTVRIVQNGAILSNPFMDISSNISTEGEGGLLSIAFHPDFQNNRKLYAYYTDTNGDSRIVEFLTKEENPNEIEPSTERLVLQQSQPFTNHNGGLIAFGRTQFLYIGFGDGGGAGDPLGSGQDLTSLLGAILRIDVNGNVPYEVPNSNPFVNDQSAREEIWAYGLRNPWKYSFDRLTGRLFLGDVGQNNEEEVNIIARGFNYGWNIREGFSCYLSTPCATLGLEDPIATYNHDYGRSITGGFVYRGNNLPRLQGHYLYGDFITGKILAASHTSTKRWESRELVDSSLFISSFGEDENGEIYVLDYLGTLHSLVQAP